jgi:hypothetical protein
MTFLISKRAKTIVSTPEAGTIQNIPGSIIPLFRQARKLRLDFLYLRARLRATNPAYQEFEIK